jgi:hypothetical protein
LKSCERDGEVIYDSYSNTAGKAIQGTINFLTRSILFDNETRCISTEARSNRSLALYTLGVRWGQPTPWFGFKDKQCSQFTNKILPLCNM